MSFPWNFPGILKNIGFLGPKKSPMLKVGEVFEMIDLKSQQIGPVFCKVLFW